ncbi:hypothetical protein ACA29_04380 [Lederbergia galactosidilytica]|uniref:Transcriptional regulator n=1 Tax=Lederbergia galactosidilytica TaxID=217031 RepID=A0A0Q9YJK5_9BACI|nr:hypothetical protein ACA29_04380 [Lederbergia galactosidilytica]
MNKELIEEYLINPFTLMFRTIIKEEKRITEIIEFEEIYYTEESPLNIIKRNCGYYGSDYEGRRNGTKQLIAITHKAPILLESHTPIYLFPTKSPQHEFCAWIAHDHVKACRKADIKSLTIVKFRNNHEYTVSISTTPFRTQLSRTAMLRIEYEKSLERIEMYNLLKQSYFMKASEDRGPYRPSISAV